MFSGEVVGLTGDVMVFVVRLPTPCSTVAGFALLAPFVSVLRFGHPLVVLPGLFNF